MEPYRHHSHHGHHHDGPAVSFNIGPTYEQIRRAKRQALAKPNFLRIIVRITTLALGAAILGVLAQASIIWYTTRYDVLSQPDGFRMPGWPNQMSLTPTWLMLAAALVGVIVQVVALLTLVGGVRRLRESKVHPWTVFFTSIVGIIIWIAAAVYFKLQDSKGQANWTLWSWSCSHENLINGKMSFKAMCVRLNFCFYTAIAVAVLEIASLVLFGYKLRHLKVNPHYTKVTVESI